MFAIIVELVNNVCFIKLTLLSGAKYPLPASKVLVKLGTLLVAAILFSLRTAAQPKSIISIVISPVALFCPIKILLGLKSLCTMFFAWIIFKA